MMAGAAGVCWAICIDFLAILLWNRFIIVFFGFRIVRVLCNFYYIYYISHKFLLIISSDRNILRTIPGLKTYEQVFNIVERRVIYAYV